MPRCGRHSFLGVFVVLSFSVSVFWLGRRGSWFSVRRSFSSRSEVARFLWRFRAARRWWRSSAAPSLSVVGSSLVPFHGLRWLAARWVVVRVSVLASSPFVVPRLRVLRQRVFVVPAGRFVRRPSAFVPARSSSFAVSARSVFC